MKPYPEDNRYDPSGFKARARSHQSAFREQELQCPCADPYGTKISDADGHQRLLNFYPGMGIREAVRLRYPKSKATLYCDLLRSEHIPFNLLWPFGQRKVLLQGALNRHLAEEIASIDDIRIEYAPAPRRQYLNDATSFDACVLYTNRAGEKGIIGIEVKYTERGYRIGDKEAAEMANPESIYYKVSRARNLYEEHAYSRLKEDAYRQVWRNHLLGERMLQVDGRQYQRFTLMTLYPAGNRYYGQVCKDYKELLVPERRTGFIGLTYEVLLDGCLAELDPADKEAQDWLAYCRRRYIVPSGERSMP